MRTRIQKWGNSLAVRIPKSYALESRIEEGALVRLSVESGKLVVAPEIPQEFKLNELLDGINKKNIHREISTGRPVGREIW